MIEIKVIEDIEDNRLSIWNDFLDASGNTLIFQRYEWIKSWWEIYSTDKLKLFILFAYRDYKLLGIAPLMYWNNWPGYSTITFIGSGYFDYFDFIVKKGEEENTIVNFINFIINKFHNFELQLKNIFKDSPSYKILARDILSKHSNGIFYREDIVPYLELPPIKEQFYSQIKKSLKTDIARQEKRLRESGELGFKQCENLEEANELLEDFFTLHIKRWESRMGYSVYKFQDRRNFLRALLRTLYHRGITGIYYLLFKKNKKIAICFAFELNKGFIYYTPAYDPDFANYSPGKILITKLIDFCIDNQFEEFDFGIGNEPYKLEWPCKIKELYNIYIYTNKSNLLNIFLRLRRYVARNYFFNVLSCLRKFHFAVYFWRMLQRKKGKYKRFE